MYKKTRKLIYDEMNRRSIKRSDYADCLQLLLDAYLDEEDGGKKKGLTSKENLANALMFFVGAYEATTSTLTFLTYELSRDEMVQKKIYREIVDNKGDEEPVYDNINKLHYLDMCIDETLRIYPPFLRYSLWQFQTFKSMGVPGPKPSLIFGTLKGDKSTFDGLTPILNIADQDMLRHLFVKQFADFTDRRVFEGFNGDLDKGLTVVKGDQWKNLRHLMSPTFSSGKLKWMTPLIVSASKSLTDHFYEVIKREPQQDMKRCTGGYTMDVIASTAFGLSVNSIKDPNDPFVENASRFLSNDVTSWKLIILLLCPTLAKYLGKCFGISFFPKDVQKFFRKVTVDAINARSTKRAGYVDFLQLMMQAHITDEEGGHGEKKGMTFQEIMSNALIFFFAGYETTASTLSFLAYELAHNQDIQDKLLEEVMKNVGMDEADYDNVSNLPYLEMCINETLRKYPPALRLDRTCTRDTDLLGLKVPKGMVVNVPIYAIHHSPDLWENPDKFDPDRFLPENKAMMTQFQFIPFGYGPRSCIGMRLALLEAKIAIVAVLKMFRFLVGEKTKLEENLGAKGLLVPTELWLKMQAR